MLLSNVGGQSPEHPHLPMTGHELQPLHYICAKARHPPGVTPAKDGSGTGEHRSCQGITASGSPHRRGERECHQDPGQRWSRKVAHRMLHREEPGVRAVRPVGAHHLGSSAEPDAAISTWAAPTTIATASTTARSSGTAPGKAARVAKAVAVSVSAVAIVHRRSARSVTRSAGRATRNCGSVAASPTPATAPGMRERCTAISGNAASTRPSPRNDPP